MNWFNGLFTGGDFGVEVNGDQYIGLKATFDAVQSVALENTQLKSALSTSTR
jgi:hypothetical protein